MSDVAFCYIPKRFGGRNRLTHHLNGGTRPGTWQGQYWAAALITSQIKSFNIVKFTRFVSGNTIIGCILQ
jgi:hypothetical protein